MNFNSKLSLIRRTSSGHSKFESQTYQKYRFKVARSQSSEFQILVRFEGPFKSAAELGAAVQRKFGRCSPSLDSQEPQV